MGFEAGPDLLCSTGSVILHFRGRFVLFFKCLTSIGYYFWFVNINHTVTPA